MSENNKQGIMFVLSSPSGTGKTTLAKMLTKNNNNFIVSVSHTTRKPRSDEKNGLDYYFISENNFFKYVKEKSFFEYAKIFSNYYGTLKEPVIKNLSKGKDVLFDIDWQGTQQLKKKRENLKLVTIFLLPPDKNTLKNRIINRNQEGKNLADERMKKFDEEISHWKEYDYVIVNNDLNNCYKKLVSIIESEKKGKRVSMDKSEVTIAISKLIK